MRRKSKQTEVGHYRHDEKRPNNSSAGLMAVYETTPAESPKREYACNPHLDPQLQFDSQGIRQCTIC